MLNVLVEKAIERSSQSKLEDHQPIFAISYSVATPNQQMNKDKRSKTVNVNKIPKIIKATDIISQRWKTTTIQKLQNMQIQTANSYPFKVSKNSHKSSIKNQDSNLNQQPVAIKSIHLSPLEYSSYVDELRNITQAPFMIKKKKFESKSHTMYVEDRHFGNSLYMRYRQGLKNKTNTKVAFNKYYYQQRRASEGDMQNHQVVNTEESEINNNNGNNECSKPKKKKNVGFINTIQYKTLPKQQVRLYKIDVSEKQKSRRSSLGHTLGIFIRTKKQGYGKNSPELTNISISPFISNQQSKNVGESNLLAPQSPKQLQTCGMNVSVRKVYTQKRTRKNFKDLQIEDLRQQFKQSKQMMNTYRPWSPVKANPPLLFVNDEDLMISQSRRQNIQIQEVEYQ